MVPMILSLPSFETIRHHCEAQWPREACGLVFGGAALRVVPMANLADQLHAQDPVSFQRDSRTAYVMDPLKVQQLVDDAEAQGEILLAIYHSHPQHPAYFSLTDQRAAMPFGFPTFPLTWQLVASVFERELVDLKGFQWDVESETWREGQVKGLPPLKGPPPGARELGDV